MYQLDYAAGRPQMYDKSSRLRKAKNIVKILSDYYGSTRFLKKLKVLDVGASSGIIDNYLAGYFNHVVGLDIDSKAIEFAKSSFKKKNLEFVSGDAMSLKFPQRSFDIVICAQVYEHVPNSKILFSEIHKVLKRNGVCYLAALNRLWPWEPHYDLPFLSWLPKKLANYYVRIFRNKNFYYETLLSYWGLKKITGNFRVVEYTSKVVSDPVKFDYPNKPRVDTNFRKLISPAAKYLSPTFLWILVKET